MTNIGTIEIQDLFVGSNNAVGLYLGAARVWEKSEPQPPQPAGPWLCFTANEANSTIRLDKKAYTNTVSLETSTDGTTWTDYNWTGTTGDTLTMTNIGDKVYMRAKTENTRFSSSTDIYYTFVGTGSFAASGNIQSLLKADCSRVDAPSSCYTRLFNGCTSLTAAPELPATTINNNCYAYMFNGCTSLITAPSELPATTLAGVCYGDMFHGCSSLTKAPALRATALKEYCYASMFNGCTHLSEIEVSFTVWNPANGTSNWVTSAGSQASGTKTFKCPSTLPQTFGSSNIPSGWTVVTT